MLGWLIARVRSVWSIRRRTFVGPLLDAFLLRAVVRRIDGFSKKTRVLGPEELAPYVRLLSVLSPARALPENIDFDHVVVRHDWVAALDRPLLAQLCASYSCTYSNSLYAVFGLLRTAGEESRYARPMLQRMRPLLESAPTGPAVRVPRVPERVVLVTTYNRPEALRRSLAQITALGCPMLVVDDGSEERLSEENRTICRACDAQYLRAPDNRGIAAALNIGLTYLIADCRIEWISYLQDDVDVDPSLMEQLRLVEDREKRPLLTAFDAPEHVAIREEVIGGVRVKLKTSTAGVHLHGHASYWWSVLPIPTGYLGAPRRRWGPPLEDEWIVRGAPTSMFQRGLLVPCLPGLVRTFLWHEGDSTWGNPTPAARERGKAFDVERIG
jgi:hypothetical protein